MPENNKRPWWERVYPHLRVAGAEIRGGWLDEWLDEIAVEIPVQPFDFNDVAYAYEGPVDLDGMADQDEAAPHNDVPDFLADDEGDVAINAGAIRAGDIVIQGDGVRTIQANAIRFDPITTTTWTSSNAYSTHVGGALVPEPEEGTLAHQNLKDARKRVADLKKALAQRGGFDVELLR